MRITGDWLTRPETRAVCAAMTAAGHRALLVGGCVRNALLGVPVADVDIATDAHPDETTRLCEDAGLRVVPTGIEHGTVTVVANGIAFEVTTFREDVETFGRAARVAFSSDVAADAARRDFTMNALYATPEGGVIDPLGGLPDLLARRVRFVGRAEDRIAEDYLRILRFFRFHALYGDAGEGLDPDALAACAAQASGLDGLSRERVGSEMRKLLSAPDPAPSLAAMQHAGVLARVLAGADSRALAPLVHIEAGRAPSWLRRLAVIGGEDAADRLRLSRSEARTLALLSVAAGSTEAPAELAYRHGPGLAADILLVRAALAGQPPAAGWEHAVARGAAAVFPVSAADLMPGVTGPDLGAKLAQLEDRWIRSDFRLTRADLLS